MPLISETYDYAHFKAALEKVVAERDTFLKDEEKGLATRNALNRYSKDCPHRVMIETTMALDRKIDLSVAPFAHDPREVADFEFGFSNPDAIEHPVDETPRPQEYFRDENRWVLDKDRKALFLINLEIALGNTYRIIYTVRHQIEGFGAPLPIPDATTVPRADWEALVSLAGSYACDILARRTINVTESQYSSDSVDGVPKSVEWTRKSKDLRKEYDDHIRPAPATMTPQTRSIRVPRQLSTGGPPFSHREGTLDGRF